VAVFENRQPVTEAKFINKSSLFILLLGVIRRQELKPIKEQKVENIFVAPPYCQTECVCPGSCLCDESRSLGGRSGATFTIKPVVCCVALRGRVVNTFATLSAGCTTGASVRAERIVKRL
jgi:hypothetical protein